jgi:hypothetical protein
MSRYINTGFLSSCLRSPLLFRFYGVGGAGEGSLIPVISSRSLDCPMQGPRSR